MPDIPAWQRRLTNFPHTGEAQKIIADANGLGIFEYEGGNGNNPEFSPALATEERARFMEFDKQCNHTPRMPPTTPAMFNQFVELGGKYRPSSWKRGLSYTMAPGRDCAIIGDSNPVWDAVVKFNGRSCLILNGSNSLSAKSSCG